MITVLSLLPAPSPYVERVNSRNDLLVDFETGAAQLGVGSSDASFEWQANSDGTTVWVSRDGVAPVVVLADTGITEVSLAFDGTMNPHVAYVAGGVSKFHWWDTLANAYATMTLPGARSPRCCSDEKHPFLSGDRDIVLAYMIGTTVRTRVQRERFAVERTLTPDAASAAKITAGTTIVQLGMNTGRRLQFRLA